MKKVKISTLLLVLVIVVSAAGNFYLYHRYKDAQNKDPNIQTQRIVDSLKKTTDVPNETPSVLTVVDKSKLTDSQIAQKAENGDKILLFQKAGEVYIYRPSTDKLINILNISSAKQSAQPSSNSTTKTTSPTPSNTSR
jgi:hypothetical protein